MKHLMIIMKQAPVTKHEEIMYSDTEYIELTIYMDKLFL